MITFGVRSFPFSDPWLIRLPIYRGSESAIDAKFFGNSLDATPTNHTSNKMCLWVDVCFSKKLAKETFSLTSCCMFCSSKPVNHSMTWLNSFWVLSFFSGVTFIVDVLDGVLSKGSILYSATNLILPNYWGNNGDLVYLDKKSNEIV